MIDDPADDYDPACSPDGTQIDFRPERDGGGIYIVPALGGEARLFAPIGCHPRVSPDDQMLMYAVAHAGKLGRYRLFAGGKPIPSKKEAPDFGRVAAKPLVRAIPNIRHPSITDGEYLIEWYDNYLA